MRLVVAVVGKTRNAALGEAIQDYEKRAARYWPLDVHEVREEKATGISVDQVKAREGVRLSERVPERAQTIACDVSGKQFSSPEFAEFLRRDGHRRRTSGSRNHTRHRTGMAGDRTARTPTNRC